MTLDAAAALLATTRLVTAPRTLVASPEPPAANPTWLPAVPSSGVGLADPAGWYQRALTSDSATSGVRVLHLAANDLSPVERAETRAFTRHSLDSTDGRVRPFHLPADTYTFAPPTWSVLVKNNRHQVITHVGIVYRVIQVGDLRVPVGGIGGVMTLPEWRGRGFARAALATALPFVATELWAPFALAILPGEHTRFYEQLGWTVVTAPMSCEQPGGRVPLSGEVAVVQACQGDAPWPSGPIDLCGAPW